jgi:hypothetical protein
MAKKKKKNLTNVLVGAEIVRFVKSNNYSPFKKILAN